MFVQTSAEGLVVLDLTVSIGPTCGLLTGVDTLAESANSLYDTGQTGATVPVGSTFIRTVAALDKGIPNKPSWTEAFEGTRYI
jgi:hypothetical protein